jgi:hypothetical protein
VRVDVYEDGPPLRGYSGGCVDKLAVMVIVLKV